jgi:hypothetical protein
MPTIRSRLLFVDDFLLGVLEEEEKEFNVMRVIACGESRSAAPVTIFVLLGFVLLLPQNINKQ